MRWPSIKLFAVFIVLVSLGLTTGWYLLQQFMNTPLNVQSDGIEYNVPRGGSLSAVAYTLNRRNVMKHPRWFILYSRLIQRGDSIHAGDYWLAPGLTPNQLLTKLESGDVRYFQVTLVEGWTLSQVLDHLTALPRIARELDGETVNAEQLGVDWTLPLEGMFFPDTYRYSSADSDVSILRQAFRRMTSILAQEWQGKAPGLPYQNSYEALIMASLIEKETGYAPEREQIAGVFVRRLQKGMRLQTDPAVIYGLGSAFTGNLRSKHLKDGANPYNTYRHHGLTPTPIALAGREAIHAALHPSAGTALYFVAKGDGTHYFSSSLEEHRRAVRKYQIEQRQKDYSSSPTGNALPESISDQQVQTKSG